MATDVLTALERGRLKATAIEEFLASRAEGWNVRAIESLLDRCGGDVGRALAQSGRLRHGEIRSVGARLGGFSFGGPGRPWVECWGTCPGAPLRVWRPGAGPWVRDEPDVVVSWREVFQYVARRRQPGLFGWVEPAGAAGASLEEEAGDG